MTLAPAFTQIPADIRTPGTYVEINVDALDGGLTVQPLRVLLIGQMFPNGTAPWPALTPREITSAADALAAFGRGSMLAQMADVYRQNDLTGVVTAIGLLDDPAHTPATALVGVSGTAQESLAQTIYVAGREVNFSVGRTDGAATVAAAIADAANANGDLPATAVTNGGVTAVAVDAPGSGYSTATVTFSAPPAGVTATGTATLLAGEVTGITVTNPGSGYREAPTVTIAGDGTGAAATATIGRGGVVGIAVTATGSGYTSAPTVTLTGGGGTGAAAVARLTGGGVTSVEITSPGIGYSSAPTVAFSGGGGSGAAATATVAPEIVILTSRHRGETQNSLDVRLRLRDSERIAAGLTYTVRPFAGGSGAPDLLASVFAEIGDARYEMIVTPYTDQGNLIDIDRELTRKFDALVNADGFAFGAIRGTIGEAIARVSGVNSRFMSMIASSQSPTPDWEWAAAYAGAQRLSLEADPARPTQTLVMNGALPPTRADAWDLTESELLLRRGLATFLIQDGGQVAIQREITTYLTNFAGQPDLGWLDLQVFFTLSYLRRDLDFYLTQLYRRFKLVNDGTNFGSGQAVVTPSQIKGSIIARGSLWEDAGLIEDAADFKRRLQVGRDPKDPNRVNASIVVNLANQLRVIAALISFSR